MSHTSDQMFYPGKPKIGILLDGYYSNEQGMPLQNRARRKVAVLGKNEPSDNR
jgi:hypothetical protein